MTKMLNLDELAQESKDRVLKLGGKEHQMKEISVKDFIEVTAMSDKLLEQGDKTSAADQVRSMVKIVHIAFPTIEVSLLSGLPMSALSTIINFINETDEDLKEEAVKAASEGESGN